MAYLKELESGALSSILLHGSRQLCNCLTSHFLTAAYPIKGLVLYLVAQL